MNTVTCPRCDNKRVILSKSCRRKIRCPLCTRRRPDRTGRHLKELTRTSKQLSGAEARRLSREIYRHVAQRIIENEPIPRIPPHLVTTDGILQRWGAVTTGQPSDNPDVYHVSRLPELDARTHSAVSDCIGALPKGARRFVWDLYRRNVPTSFMAKRRHMTPRSFGREWLRILVDLRQRFQKSPHPDLVKLVRVLP